MVVMKFINALITAFLIFAFLVPAAQVQFENIKGLTGRCDVAFNLTNRLTKINDVTESDSLSELNRKPTLQEQGNQNILLQNAQTVGDTVDSELSIGREKVLFTGLFITDGKGITGDFRQTVKVLLLK